MTTNQPTGKEVEAVLKAGQLALKKKDATLADVIAAMSSAEVHQVQQAFALTQPIPQQVIVTADEKESFLAFVDVVSSLAFPNKVRTLNTTERRQITLARVDYDRIKRVLDAFETSSKTAIHNHQDKAAEAAGLVDESTPLNKDRHYVLPDADSMVVPDLPVKFTREVSRGAIHFGSNVELDDLLLQALEEGKITRKQYLKWTRAVRVVDQEAIFNDLANPKLLEVIYGLARQEPPTASIHLRKNDA